MNVAYGCEMGETVLVKNITLIKQLQKSSQAEQVLKQEII